MIRIFAHALARRVAYVVFAAALAWLGLSTDARAGRTGCDLEDNCTREQAYQAAVAYRDWVLTQPWGQQFASSIYINTSGTPLVPPPGGLYRVYCYSGAACEGSPFDYFYHYGCPAGKDWDEEAQTCGVPCSDKPPIPGNERHALGPESSFCYEGCFYTGRGSCLGVVIDGIESTYCSYWTTEPGATCSVGESPEPIPAPVDSDGDGISDEHDLSPNNPGVGDATGEPSRACGGPGQPECLPDGSNEGSGRGNTSSGGGDCNTPPRSTGDAILAQIAFQTWATRCAITAAANQVGDGTGPGTGDGDSVLDQLRDEAAGLDTSLGEGDADDAWIEGPTSLDLDTSGLGIGGTCPAPPTINGVSIDPDNNLCMLVQIIGSLVLVGAFAHAGYIIGRA